MSQIDSIIEEAEHNVVASIRLAQQIGEALRARRTLKLQQSQQEMYAEQARLNQELAVVRPYLSEGMREVFWNNAEAEDMSRMLGVAARFRDVDPTAEQVYSRALREIEDRYGPTEGQIQDVNVEELADEEIEQAIPQVAGENIAAADVKEGRDAQKEPVPEWVNAWAEDMRKGQAKSVEYYQELYAPGDVASAEAEANRAHLEADQARAHEKGLEAEVEGVEVSPEAEQAKGATISAEERERAAEVRRDQIGVEAAKAVEIKDVSFPEPAAEGIKRSGPMKKVRQAIAPRKQVGRAR